MTITEAEKICEDFYRLTNPDDEDRFLMAEALDYLITETKDPGYMLELGSLYYEQKQFDLARKYYELAAEYDDTRAMLCLGYIWYYGRTGTRDYEKAFHYYDSARQRGDVNAAYKVADMYRKGLYVKKDPARYRKIIEELYNEFRRNSSWYIRHPYSKLPEIYLRMGEILTEDGQNSEALKLFQTAKSVVARRIRDSAFFGDRTIMKELVGKIYELRRTAQEQGTEPGRGTDPGRKTGPFQETDPEETGLFDLYELLKAPCLVRFFFEGELHETEASEEAGAVVIRFDDEWYRTADDYFAKAQIGGELLTTLYEELYGFDVIKK